MNVSQLVIDLVRSVRAQEIADELIGTAKSLHDATIDIEREDGKLMEALSELCFECDCCGWWASTDELNNDNELGEELCDECDEVDA